MHHLSQQIYCSHTVSWTIKANTVLVSLVWFLHPILPVLDNENGAHSLHWQICNCWAHDRNILLGPLPAMKSDHHDIDSALLSELVEMRLHWVEVRRVMLILCVKVAVTQRHTLSFAHASNVVPLHVKFQVLLLLPVIHMRHTQSVIMLHHILKSFCKRITRWLRAIVAHHPMNAPCSGHLIVVLHFNNWFKYI